MIRQARTAEPPSWNSAYQKRQCARTWGTVAYVATDGIGAADPADVEAFALPVTRVSRVVGYLSAQTRLALANMR